MAESKRPPTAESASRVANLAMVGLLVAIVAGLAVWNYHASHKDLPPVAASITPALPFSPSAEPSTVVGGDGLVQSCEGPPVRPTPVPGLSEKAAGTLNIYGIRPGMARTQVASLAAVNGNKLRSHSGQAGDVDFNAPGTVTSVSGTTLSEDKKVLVSTATPMATVTARLGTPTVTFPHAWWWIYPSMSLECELSGKKVQSLSLWSSPPGTP